MIIKKEMVLRNIAGDYVLVPAGGAVKEYNGLFALTEVAARIWELLPTVATEADIVAALSEEYDAPTERLQADVKAFLDKLRHMDLI